MVRELAENNFLKDFGQEGEVWHWSVVFQDLGVKSCFLEERLHDRWFKSRYGKRRECRESLMIDVRSGRRSSRQWVRKDVGTGSSSHVFIVDRVSIFFTSSSETDWKAPQTVPQKGWSSTEGGVTVVESRLQRMEVTLLWKKSENYCGSSERGMDKGSGEDLTLPRREFVMLKSCLDVLLARILCCRKIFWLDAQYCWQVCWQNEIFVCERAVPTWSTVFQLSVVHALPQEAGFQRKRTKEKENGWRLCDSWQGHVGQAGLGERGGASFENCRCEPQTQHIVT